MRRTIRWLFGPTGRLIGLTLLVGLAWLRWALQPALLLETLTLPAGKIIASCGHSNGGSLFVTEQGETITGSGSCAVGPLSIWDLATGRVRSSFLDHNTVIQGMVLAPGGAWLAVLDPHGVFTVCDTTTGRRLCDLRVSTANTIGSWVATHSRGFAVIRGDNGAIQIWNADAERVTATLEGAHPPMVFSPDGRTSATRWNGPTVRLWDATTGEGCAILGPFPDTIRDIQFAPDGQSLAVVSERPEIGPMPHYDVTLIDRNNARVLATLSRYQRSFIPAPEFSPDGRLLLLRGDVGTGLVWDLTLSPPRARDDLFADPCLDPKPWRTASTSVSFGEMSWRFPVFAPDGKLLAVVTDDTADAVRLLNAATGESVATCRLAELRDRHIGDAKFSPDGKTLAVSLIFVDRGQPKSWREWLEQTVLVRK